jgi:UDP-N-acetylmuramoylalanine--D-glutamate ligase
MLEAHVGTATKVFLGGNVRGVATLPFLREAKEGDFAVLELDSWQLQGFGERKISPHVSIFTTLLPDHQNYYKGDMDAYLDDKANIFKFQTSVDTLILGSQPADLIRKSYPKIKSRIVIPDQNNIPDSWNVGIPGEHNRYNISLALEAAKALAVPLNIVKEAVEHFKGVPGRLELIREYKGVKIYNDTTATTPDATMAALKALSKNKNIVLIMGGADKNLEMGKLVSVLPEHCKSIVLLPGSGTSRIEKEILGLSGVTVSSADSLREAVSNALSESKAGDMLLLSPAFASFGIFKNEFDRGEQFDDIVKNLA